MSKETKDLRKKNEGSYNDCGKPDPGFLYFSGNHLIQLLFSISV